MLALLRMVRQELLELVEKVGGTFEKPGNLSVDLSQFHKWGACTPGLCPVTHILDWPLLFLVCLKDV